MGSLTDMWRTPPPLCEIFFGILYFSWGILCPLICYIADYVSAGVMTIGLGVWEPLSSILCLLCDGQRGQKDESNFFLSKNSLTFT